MRVLVTGAAGFIGSTVTDRLLADGHEVVGVDDLSRGSIENLTRATAGGAGRFSLERCDVTGPAFLTLVAERRPEVVCHLAAQIDVRVSVDDPWRDAALNVLGTINVLEAARRSGVRKVVFTSSGGSIYGSPEALPVAETAPLAPASQYAASKIAGEVYLSTYGRLYGLQTTALALANVYGPRQDPHGEAGVVSMFVDALLCGRRATIYGDGRSTRDYVFVGDVADAFALSLGPEGDGCRLNIGTGVQVGVAQLHSAVAAAVGAPDVPLHAPARLGELTASALDASLAARTLGWTPRTDLATGLAATVSWIAARSAAGLRLAG
jgi:UDP-glucose 4-epimerase